MPSISENLNLLQNAIVAAAGAANRRPSDVTLLAVSKTFPAELVVEAVAAGQREFGESYVQEALTKMAEVQQIVPDIGLIWHFIGPIQRNKTRIVAENFAWAHAVDRIAIAERLSAQRPPGLQPLNICLQVNVSGESSKHGVTPAAAPELAAYIARLPGIRLRGLMAIPEPTSEPEYQRLAFRRMRELFEQLRQSGLDLDTLSMGMSADMKAAIAEGATIVRIGTAIFGSRDYDN